MADSVLRIGDLFRERYRTDLVMIVGHHIGESGRPCAWRVIFIPVDGDEGPFAHYYPYDFAEQDAMRPGSLLPVDPWSTWAENID